jgi:hypothetical protein
MKAQTPCGQTMSLQSCVLVRFLYIALVERFSCAADLLAWLKKQISCNEKLQVGKRRI